MTNRKSSNYDYLTYSYSSAQRSDENLEPSFDVSELMSLYGMQDIAEDENSERSDYGVPLPPRSSKGRTMSTTIRLQRQGLRTGSGVGNFAVQSIQRGSHNWAALIKPFVSDLAFRSLIRRRYQSELSFRPYACPAAVLFVDLSGYSKITAAIAHRGAHFLSSVVNAYLEIIIKIVHSCGGDVVKFAGDAVLVVWEGKNLDLTCEVLCAAQCALKIQSEAASFPVEGTDLAFSTHCAIACGNLESEIFVAPTSVNMQRLYHSVGGEAVKIIGELVDLAKTGETCIDKACIQVIDDRGLYRNVIGAAEDCEHKIVTGLVIDPCIQEVLDAYIDSTVAGRIAIRSKMIEEDFIHPSVLKLLSHGGLSPTQIAQMRNLCVLFIAMTSQGSSCNWLMEVQGVLDKNRCPIVQIIDDDKGVHIVAAVNLYETIPEANILGLDICRELIDQEVGCAIGVAAGTTFCGVTGSNLACRWDITGPPAVRSARLMQFAVANNYKVAIDESVYLDPMAAAKMKLAQENVILKGTLDPISVYTLSDSKIHSAFRVLETVYGRCHDKQVFTITDWITRPENHRCAVLVKGPPFAGKKIVCQRAAGYAEMVPFLHVCDHSFGLLQLARTIALWFQYAEHPSVVKESEHVTKLMNKRKWSRAHDACITLVDKAVKLGMRACFLVDRIQFVDDFSLSLIRECLVRDRLAPDLLARTSGDSLTDIHDSYVTGTICFLCVHVSLYNHLSAHHIIEDITRANKMLQVPIVEVIEAQSNELRTMLLDISDVEVEERWLRTYAESSGYCAGYFMRRADTLRNLSAKLWKEGKAGYSITSEELTLIVPPGYIRRIKEIKVMEISTSLAMRFAQLFDDLPPLFQLFVKVLHVATRKGFYKLPRTIMWEALNDLIAEGMDGGEMAIVLDEMKEMYFIAIDYDKGDEFLSFRTPALGDIAMDVCTPVQIQTISLALLERLEPIASTDFKVPLVLADLNITLGRKNNLRNLWRKSYLHFLEVSVTWPKSDINHWKETIDDEIQAAGYATADILGDDFFYPLNAKRSVGIELPLLKGYTAPIAFGPMGHSLSVICRNVFQEFAIFHGAREEDTKRLLNATQSASERYLKEMEVVDNFLEENGFITPETHKEGERACVQYLATPSRSDREVILKARQILNVYIPFFVQSRLQKLRDLVIKLHKGPTPEVIKNSPSAIRRAYETLQSAKCLNDAAQQAFVIMAFLNWKPREVPEYLPSKYYQTVACIRTTVLRRLNESELAVMIHQQSICDFEAFLLITPLLYSAPEVNTLLYFRPLCG